MLTCCKTRRGKRGDMYALNGLPKTIPSCKGMIMVLAPGLLHCTDHNPAMLYTNLSHTPHTHLLRWGSMQKSLICQNVFFKRRPQRQRRAGCRASWPSEHQCCRP